MLFTVFLSPLLSPVDTWPGVNQGGGTFLSDDLGAIMRFLCHFSLIAYHSVNCAVTMDDVGKRKAISIEDKVKFIRKLQNGESQSAICKEYSLSKSTVATIWKNHDSIISVYGKNINECKRLQKADIENVKEALFKWFTLQSSRNLPITDSILQAKANEFVELFEDKSLVCSNGWLDRFKKRHNIRSGKVVCEAVVFVLPISITGWKMFGRTLFAITMKRTFSTPMKQVCFTSSLEIKVQRRKMCLW
ncbi:Tigger transposable element-derived protein 4 [Araneus ventricosus]|uniref:Tigger transposable element-derived protein 4 n=1 Tax=Araneus ventricosus TaxID=182803 RepID=A0A4Y2AFN3_ARAVE|nr:Tigger transposable element-derived protein 4 [Araneus ventricosus]